MLLLLLVDSKKRLWIYSGMGLTSGVGLVSTGQPTPSTNRLRRGFRVLLIGDALAQGLSTPLKQLAQADGVLFASDTRPGAALSEWSKQPWLRLDLSKLKPNNVIAVGAGEPLRGWPQALLDVVRSFGASLTWISPPRVSDPALTAHVLSIGVPVFHSETLGLPRNPHGVFPTPAEYAGWSALVWRWLTNDPRSLPYDSGPYRQMQQRQRRGLFVRR